MIKIKNIIVIVERNNYGANYNQRLEFETLKNLENWVKYKKARGKLN